MLLIVFSKTDPFSKNVFERLEALLQPIEDRGSYVVYKFRDIPVLLDREHDLPFTQYLDYLCKQLQVSHVVFVSRHEMKNPRPMITLHVPGNWREAEVGGISGKVSLCDAHFHSNLARLMYKFVQERNLIEKYEFWLEATHHGPSLDVPSTFIEVGSTEREWSDTVCVQLFVDIVSTLVENYEKLKVSSKPIHVVYGDLHYANITKHVIQEELDVGHIVPKYVQLDEDIVRNAITRTIPTPTHGLIYWKSLKKEDRDLICKVLTELKIEIVKKK